MFIHPSIKTNIENKVVLTATGSSGGIGGATARLFAGKGAKGAPGRALHQLLEKIVAHLGRAIIRIVCAARNQASKIRAKPKGR